MTIKTISGYGKALPPSKEHVVIYFLQKDQPEEKALSFFRHFQDRKWQNERNDKIKNWKIVAWNWIFNFCSTS